MLLDFATTAAAGVKVVNARNRNEPVPEGWIANREGEPTTDPNDFFDGGGHLPFGGHKGWGVMLASELISQVLTGSQNYADERYAGEIMRYQATTMIVFRADLFQSLDDCLSRADEVLGRVRSIRPAKGFDRVMVPGDKEADTRARRVREGIPIPDDTWQSIVECAASLGIDATEAV